MFTVHWISVIQFIWSYIKSHNRSFFIFFLFCCIEFAFHCVRYIFRTFNSSSEKCLPFSLRNAYKICVTYSDFVLLLFLRFYVSFPLFVSLLGFIWLSNMYTGLIPLKWWKIPRNKDWKIIIWNKKCATWKISRKMCALFVNFIIHTNIYYRAGYDQNQ